MKINKLKLCLFLPLLSLTSCSNWQIKPDIDKEEDEPTVEIKKPEFLYNQVEISYEEPVELTTIEKPVNLNDRDDLISFFDYSVFYGQDKEYIYTDLSDSYKDYFVNNKENEVRWAGQYGSLSHNFLEYIDYSRLPSSIIGASGSIGEYAIKTHEKPIYDFQTYNFKYYEDVLKNVEHDRNYSIKDFKLYKENNGFVEVNNSEQLFYTVSKGYFPYINKENKELEQMFSSSLGILNRLLEEDQTDYEKYERIYSYMTNEILYDYNALLTDEESVNPRDYSCYYLDGVLKDNLAVCDGLTKGMCLLCGLEGISSYHIGGVGHSGSHAYNYSNIFDTYYLTCVTNGSKKVSFKKNNFLNHTYQYFLASYSPSSEWDYQSDSYEELKKEVQKNKTFDYWSNTFIEVGNEEKVSLNIESLEQALKLLNYVDSVANDTKIPLDIEILIDIDLYQEVLNKFKRNNFVCSGTNGFFEDKLLVDYTFVGGINYEI